MISTVDRDQAARRALSRAVEARRLAAQFHAMELEALADYSHLSVEDDFAHLEVSTLLHVSDRAAQHRLRFARTLTENLPTTLACLRHGEIEEFKAQLIADAVVPLTEHQAAQVEARVLDKASQQTPGQLRRALAKAVLLVDPDGAEERRQKKVSERRVTKQATEDGQGMLIIYDSLEHIASMYGAIDARAHRLKRMGGEKRTLDQLRADVAREMILGSGCAHRSVEVHLTVNGEVAEIDGLGPITPQAARDLAAEAKTWRWIRTDPETGEVVDLTYPQYQPPEALREFIKVRDRTCRYPGCQRPARACDIDHTVRWPEGDTCDANCHCLCRRHHRAKHKGKWDLKQTKPGYFTWRSPLGFTHTVEPEPVGSMAPESDPDPPPF